MLSVVLATYNEEANLERCLSSVAEFADEIVVVDGSSTDNTRQLAKKLGARVIKTTNKPNFHINKQMAMDAAKGKLVLQLDADEVVDDDLATFILDEYKARFEHNTKSPEAQPVAWWLNRKNYFLGSFLKKGGQYPDPVIRLYINGFAKLPQKDVHEQMTVTGEVGVAGGHLIHYGNPSFADYLRKFNTYTSFKAAQLKEAGTKITVGNSFKHLVWQPLQTFFSLYCRHKGFVDGVPGFVFAVMSGLHHSIAYLKLWETYESTDRH